MNYPDFSCDAFGILDILYHPPPHGNVILSPGNHLVQAFQLQPRVVVAAGSGNGCRAPIRGNLQIRRAFRVECDRTDGSRKNRGPADFEWGSPIQHRWPGLTEFQSRGRIAAASDNFRLRFITGFYKTENTENGEDDTKWPEQKHENRRHQHQEHANNRKTETLKNIHLSEHTTSCWSKTVLPPRNLDKYLGRKTPQKGGKTGARDRRG